MLVSLALQGDTCTTNSIDAKHIRAVATNRTYEDVGAEHKEVGFVPLQYTDDQLNLVEADLNQHHSSEKVQHAMKILRGFQKDLETAIVSDKTQTTEH